MQAESHTRRNVIAVVVMVIVVVAIVWVWLNFARESKPPPRPVAAVQVTTVKVTEQNVPVYRTGVGTVTALASVTVKPRIDGQLDKVAFTEGQDVKAGQLLAQIDPRTLEAQLAQVKAQKARDQAQLGNANNDLRRYTTLIGQDAATQQQVDTQKALVAQFDAAVKTDDAQINFAQVQLSFTRIVAPISGRVGARLVDAGNIVHAADPGGLVVINQIDPINVVFTLPEEAFQDINHALHASAEPLQVVAYPRDSGDALGAGKLVLLNNQIDTTTGTVQLKGSFANAGHALWPGQYVNVKLLLRHDPHALTVPEAAVQRSQEGTFVWVIDAQQKASTRPVRVAAIQDGIAVLDSGVKAGERVVVDGQYKLRPGVVVVEAGKGASGPASAASSAGTTTSVTSPLAAATGSRP
ncbi:MAG: efflux RND transporter periplasmic adaptor subunit [Pseudomonadota bacterium]|nr:efflux RND transporter periplasmic adaptor subunit [Pseudomonadota bacterium]